VYFVVIFSHTYVTKRTHAGLLQCVVTSPHFVMDRPRGSQQEKRRSLELQVEDDEWVELNVVRI
jgi:hypothetical protein